MTNEVQIIESDQKKDDWVLSLKKQEIDDQEPVPCRIDIHVSEKNKVNQRVEVVKISNDDIQPIFRASHTSMRGKLSKKSLSHLGSASRGKPSQTS